MKINLKDTSMRTNSIIFLILLGILSSCNTQQEGIRIQVTNTMDQARNDAIILFSRQAISSWTEIPEGKWPALKNGTGEFIPSQVDDLDGNGEWDELFALIDMDASSQQIVNLSFLSPEEYPTFKTRTNIRLGDASVPGYPELQVASRLEGISFHNYGRVTSASFQMEGPAWENDKVGFRNYLDQRNGMDIFGKLTHEMVLDSVGIKGRQSYHEAADWGMDVLKVGTSLGSGAIGYLYKDSIYRVGDNGSGSYHVVIEGPLHSRFNLSFTDWMVDDQSLKVNHQVEIIAGRHFYQGLVSYSGSDQKLSLVTGIVNIKSDSLYVLNLDNNYTGLFTHDFQSEDSSRLAMALIVPSAYLKSYGAAKDQGEGITQTYYVVLDTQEDIPVPYRFYALWEKEDSRWASPREVEAFLKSEAERWTQSLIYEVLL
jgi:hypothetical protein